MKKQFNGQEFVQAVYAASEPSVDFFNAEKIIPWEHKLKISVYEELLNEFCGDDTDLRLGCNMFMLNQGPQLYEA